MNDAEKSGVAWRRGMLTSGMEEWCGVLTSGVEEWCGVLTPGRKCAVECWLPGGKSGIQKGRAAAQSADFQERHGFCSKEPTTAVTPCIRSAHGGDVATNPKVGRSIHMKLMVCGKRRDRFFPSGCPSWFYLNLAQASIIPEERVSVEKMPPYTHTRLVCRQACRVLNHGVLLWQTSSCVLGRIVVGFELWAGNTIEHSKFSRMFCGHLEDRNVESSANWGGLSRKLQREVWESLRDSIRAIWCL